MDRLDVAAACTSERRVVVGPEDSLLGYEVFGPAVQALDQGTVDTDTAWNQALARLYELVPNA